MRETVDFKEMMKGLMIKPESKKQNLVVTRSKNESVYKLNGYEEDRVRSFFKRRRIGKC